MDVQNKYLIRSVGAEEPDMMSLLNSDQCYTRPVVLGKGCARLSDSPQLLFQANLKLAFTNAISVEQDAAWLMSSSFPELDQQCTNHGLQVCNYFLEKHTKPKICSASGQHRTVCQQSCIINSFQAKCSTTNSNRSTTSTFRVKNYIFNCGFECCNKNYRWIRTMPCQQAVTRQRWWGLCSAHLPGFLLACFLQSRQVCIDFP